jgi:hypothetical protein
LLEELRTRRIVRPPLAVIGWPARFELRAATTMEGRRRTTDQQRQSLDQLFEVRAGGGHWRGCGRPLALRAGNFPS